MDSLCAEPASLSRSPEDARRWPRRDDKPFMSQFPLEGAGGTSRDEPPTLGLAGRDPACRKEDFQLGKVCTLLPRPVAPVGGVLERAATVAPSRDEVLSEGGPRAPGLVGSPRLSLAVSRESHSTVRRGPLLGEAGPSAVNSWLCFRIKTVIRCWTRDVPAKERGQEWPWEWKRHHPGALSRLCKGSEREVASPSPREKPAAALPPLHPANPAWDGQKEPGHRS